MRIFTGDHVGLLKLTDTTNKSISFPNEAQSRPDKLSEALAITSMCFGDDNEQWLCYVRKTGTLEIVSLLESDDVRQCLALKLPAEPFFISRIKNLGGVSGSHLIIVCRTGEILQIDFSKLVECYEKYVTKSTDQFWPAVPTAKNELDSDDDDNHNDDHRKDWRLDLAISPWLTDEIEKRCQPLSLKSPEDYYPSTRPVSKKAACEPNAENEEHNDDHVSQCELLATDAVEIARKPLPKCDGAGTKKKNKAALLLARANLILEDVLVGYGKLTRKKSLYVESAYTFKNIQGDWTLLVGGKKMYLRAIKLSGQGKFEVSFYAGERQDMLKKWEQISSKCVGHLGTVHGSDWVYSIDQDGRLMIYDPPNREALIVFQATFDKKCPALCTAFTDLLENEPTCFVEDSSTASTDDDDDETDPDASSVGNHHLRQNKLKRKLLIADHKGQSYMLKLIYDPNSDFSTKRKQKRSESGYLEEYFVRAKKKARVNPAFVPKMRSILESRDDNTADSLYVKGHGRLLGLEGSIVCAEVCPDKKSVVLGGLSRKLFIFAKPKTEWQLLDKVYLKNKIYSMLVSRKPESSQN